MKIVIKMDVGVNELRKINKAWAMSGIGSFEHFVISLLVAAAKDAAFKQEGAKEQDGDLSL